jgi:hypothetical protein
MLIRLSILIVPAALLFAAGCAGDVSTTDDSTKMEVEGPKLETGDAETDLDPSTDDDVDIDTPLDGDS